MSCISRILGGGRFKVMVYIAGYLVGASGPPLPSNLLHGSDLEAVLGS